MRQGVTAFIMIMQLCGLPAIAFAENMDLLSDVKVHGFISQGFMKSTEYNYLLNDSQKGSFQYNEFGINFTKQLTPKLRVGLQLFARDLGDAANDKITLDWAYGDYRYKYWLGLRAGKIRLSYGLYNETRDADMLRPCIVLPQSVYPDLIRDTFVAVEGAGLYGTIPMSQAGNLEYQFQTGSMSIDAGSGADKYVFSTLPAALQNQRPTISFSDTETLYNGTLAWNTPIDGLSLKGTYFKARGTNRLTFADGTSLSISTKVHHAIWSLEYLRNNLMLATEYRIYDAYTSTTSYRSIGYYGMASYRFLNWFEAGTYYSVIYPNSGDKEGDRYPGTPYRAWQKDSALFARFDISRNFTFKVEGHYVNGTAHLLSTENPSMDKKHWYYGAAKATFSF